MRQPLQIAVDRALLLYALHSAEPHGLLSDVKLQQLCFLSELQMFGKGLKGFHFEFFRFAYGAFSIYMKNRDQKGLGGQILLYAFLATLFLIDFFMILKRDGFRASWSLSFWLALAAFIVGERVGRWSSSIAAAEAAPEPEESALK